MQDPNQAFFSAEDADLFQDLLNAVDNDKPQLQNHHVVLKSKSAPTIATKIWKNYVRHVFGKKKMLTDNEIRSLKELQDLHYRCANGGDFHVTFWVQAGRDDNSGVTKCYLGDVAYVPATEACLRDEIKNNGVPPHKRKRKRIEGENPKMQSECRKHQEDETKQGELTCLPRFALTHENDDWKEMVNLICQDWVRDSPHWVERVAKQHLVDKLDRDLTRYHAFWEQMSIQGTLEDYDLHRQALHSSLFLDIVNKMGNGMIEWYDQDLRARSSCFRSGGGNDDDPDSHSRGDRLNGQFEGGGGAPLDDRPGGFPPRSGDHSFGGNDASPDGMNDDDCVVSHNDSSSDYDDCSEYDDSLSYWTGSEYGPSTCSTSLLDEDTNGGGVHVSVHSCCFDPEPTPASKVDSDSSYGRDGSVANGNLSCKGYGGQDKRYTPQGEDDHVDRKCKQDFRGDGKHGSQLENIQTDVPMNFRPRYGETRQYWQRQVLKDVTPFLPWQRVAFHNIR